MRNLRVPSFFLAMAFAAASAAHAVEVRALDGRVVAARRGEGPALYAFTSLRPGVYAVNVAHAGRRFQRLVTGP